MVIAVVAVVAALIVVIAVVAYRLTRSNDTVETFRRQIDALSPEARRSVVDQVKGIDDRADDDGDLDQAGDAGQAGDVDQAGDDAGDDESGAGRDGT